MPSAIDNWKTPADPLVDSLILLQGEGLVYGLDVEDDAGLVDLTGIPLRMQFRVHPEDSAALLSIDASTSSGSRIHSPAAGQIDIIITEAAAALLPLGKCQGDLFADWQYGSDLVPQRLLTLSLEIRKASTRR